MEEWRPFFNGLYEVSNLGNVRRATAGVNTHAGRVKKPSQSSNGYFIFGVFANGARTNFLVHRAVAEAFLGPIPVGAEVNHKDGNKLNNRLDNLEVVTVSENVIHALRTGLAKLPQQRATGNSHWTRKYPERVKRGDENGARKSPEAIWRGEKCKSSKLAESAVKEIRELHVRGVGQNEIAQRFGITRRNVHHIVAKKSWRHVL